MSKGSNQRPTDLNKFRDNYDSIDWSKRPDGDGQMLLPLDMPTRLQSVDPVIRNMMMCPACVQFS